MVIWMLVLHGGRFVAGLNLVTMRAEKKGKGQNTVVPRLLREIRTLKLHNK